MNKAQAKAALGGFVRHALTTAGGYLVGAGYLDAAQTETFVGGGMALFGVAWSIYQKHRSAKE